MLSAIRNSDSKKVIGQLIDKDLNEKYLCERCKENVIHHKSKSGNRIGHFKHESGSVCSNYKPMSPEHLEIQFQILNYISENYNSVRTIETEKWLANKSIRADVYIETKRGTKIGIEVQTSSITHDEISRRTEQYGKNNIYVLWILPYDESRLVEIDNHNELSYYKKIKLNSYELFLLWSNFNTLYFWDKDGRADNFIKMKLMKYSVPQDDYYDEYGNIQSAPDRVSKTFKLVDEIKEIEFSDFNPKKVNEFEPKNIPERKILISDI